jgi:hypothetical protein
MQVVKSPNHFHDCKNYVLVLKDQHDYNTEKHLHIHSHTVYNVRKIIYGIKRIFSLTLITYPHLMIHNFIMFLQDT